MPRSALLQLSVPYSPHTHPTPSWLKVHQRGGPPLSLFPHEEHQGLCINPHTAQKCCCAISCLHLGFISLSTTITHQGWAGAPTSGRARARRRARASRTSRSSSGSSAARRSVRRRGRRRVTRSAWMSPSATRPQRCQMGVMREVKKESEWNGVCAVLLNVFFSSHTADLVLCMPSFPDLHHPNDGQEQGRQPVTLLRAL